MNDETYIYTVYREYTWHLNTMSSWRTWIVRCPGNRPSSRSSCTRSCCTTRARRPPSTSPASLPTSFASPYHWSSGCMRVPMTWDKCSCKCWGAWGGWARRTTLLASHGFICWRGWVCPRPLSCWPMMTWTVRILSMRCLSSFSNWCSMLSLS